MNRVRGSGFAVTKAAAADYIFHLYLLGGGGDSNTAHLCCVPSFLLFFFFSFSCPSSGVPFTRRVADYCFHRRDGRYLFPLLSDVFRLIAASAFCFFPCPPPRPSLPFAAMDCSLLMLLTQRCLPISIFLSPLRSALPGGPRETLMPHNASTRGCEDVWGAIGKSLFPVPGRPPRPAPGGWT